MFSAFGWLAKKAAGMVAGQAASKAADTPPANAPTEGVFGKAREGLTDALAGIPSAAVNSYVGGRLGGMAQRHYMDKAYPGTSAHERLRGSIGSQGAAVGGVSDQYRIARLQARNSYNIARVQADAQKYSADRTSEAARGELASKIDANVAKADFDRVNAELGRLGIPNVEERAKLANELAKAELTQAQYSKLLPAIANIMGSPEGWTKEKLRGAVEQILPAEHAETIAWIASALFGGRSVLRGATAFRKFMKGTPPRVRKGEKVRTDSKGNVTREEHEERSYEDLPDKPVWMR